jgi:8-oxo-dGTP pyrophosphatase MutT (NUDIX family)
LSHRSIATNLKTGVPFHHHWEERPFEKGQSMTKPLPLKRYTAAGGVVVEIGGQRVLVLLRPTRRGPGGQPELRLPKGHVKINETLPQAALRETEEETGLTNLKVVSELGQQLVEFDWQGYHYVRDEFYFLMTLTPHSRSTGAEAQFEPRWLPWTEAIDRLTFEAEQVWVQRARSAWSQSQARQLQNIADQDTEQPDDDAQVQK